jgi:hypothetical protein
MGSLLSLPNDYDLKEEINLMTNKKQFFYVNLWSVLVIFPVLLLLFFVDFDHFEIFDLFIGFGLFFLIIIIHEWIHGLFFKHYSKQKVKYKFHGWAASASTPGVFYYKKSYIVIGLSPAVIINGILLIIFFLVEPARVMTFILLAMHFSGCSGDFYVVYKLRKYSKETLVEDTGVGMNLFTKQQ